MILAAIGGGLGVFLLGMRHLSDGLQSASGERLRRFMSLATGRRLAGVATGVFSTILVQSSSIIAVMLVGFVTSRLMTLTEALNVLIGANIGTTFTVWLMAFAPSPEMLGLAVFCIGALMYFPFRTMRIHYVGLALVGLGLVFLGMFFMKEGVAPIKDSPAMSAALRALAATDFAHVALVAFVSAAFTAIIQSSAASIVIFMTFATQGLLSYETAVAALFGANVGTTMTGWLAAIGGGSGAKRTALAHTLTNAVGSIVFLPLVLPVFVPMGRALFPDAFTPTADGLFPRIMLPIAVTDTVFSILRGVLFYPFVHPLARLLSWIVKEPPEEKPHLSALTLRGKSSPVIAVAQATEEVAFMAESIADLMAHVRLALAGEADEQTEAHIFRREDILDNVQREVTTFLGEVMLTRMSTETAYLARRLLRLADEFESVSDEAPAVIKALRRLRAEDGALSGSERALVLDIHDRAETLARFEKADLVTFHGLAQKRELAKELKQRILAARQVQLLRIGGDNGASAASVLAALDIFNAYDRMRGACVNIAEVLES